MSACYVPGYNESLNSYDVVIDNFIKSLIVLSIHDEYAQETNLEFESYVF